MQQFRQKCIVLLSSARAAGEAITLLIAVSMTGNAGLLLWLLVVLDAQLIKLLLGSCFYLFLAPNALSAVDTKN